MQTDESERASSWERWCRTNRGRGLRFEGDSVLPADDCASDESNQ